MLLNLMVESPHRLSMPEQEYVMQECPIILKTFNSANIDDFMEWATDDEVTKYMMWNSYTSRNDAEIFFANVIEKHPWFKAIYLEDKVIGSITLDKGKGVHHCKAELGYVISRKYWGKGYATLAVMLAMQTGFQDLDVGRIEAYVDPENVGSQRVLEKNRFEKEGLLRSCIVQKGVIKDRYIYALLNSTELHKL